MFLQIHTFYQFLQIFTNFYFFVLIQTFLLMDFKMSMYFKKCRCYFIKSNQIAEQK